MSNDINYSVTIIKSHFFGGYITTRETNPVNKDLRERAISFAKTIEGIVEISFPESELSVRAVEYKTGTIQIIPNISKKETKPYRR